MSVINTLKGFDINVIESVIHSLLSAFESDETIAVTVDLALNKKGRSHPNRMTGWSAINRACFESEHRFELHPKKSAHSPNRLVFHPIRKKINMKDS